MVSVFSRFKSYTQFVSVTKIVLLLCALFLAGVLVVVPLLNPVNKDFKITFTSLNTQKDDAGNDVPTMVAPLLQGADEKGQVYQVTAKTAQRAEDGEISLNQLSAELNLHSGQWLSILANKGVYNPQSSTLDLKGKVRFFTGDGIHIETEKVQGNINTSSARTLTPIILQSEAGSLQANRMVIEEHGDVIRFEGGVQATLYP